MSDDSIEAVEVDDDEMDEELGYTECDWDKFPAKSAAAHDRVLVLEWDELEALDVDDLDDLGKWAAAQAFWDHGAEDRFRDIALQIVRSKTQHPAIDYVEICLEMVNDFMLDEAWDEAVFLLPDVERLVSDDPTLRARLGALINIGRDRVDDGMAVFQELADEGGDDAELLLLLAHDLFTVSQDEAAYALLDKAEEVASLEQDRELLEDIAQLRADLEDESAD